MNINNQQLQNNATAMMFAFQYSTNEQMMKKIEELQKEVCKMKSDIMIGSVNKIPDDAIKSCIVTYIENLKDGTKIYPSDVASKYSLDGDDVERVMDQMMREGYFR